MKVQLLVNEHAKTWLQLGITHELHITRVTLTKPLPDYSFPYKENWLDSTSYIRIVIIITVVKLMTLITMEYIRARMSWPKLGYCRAQGPKFYWSFDLHVKLFILRKDKYICERNNEIGLHLLYFFVSFDAWFVIASLV